MTDKQNFPAFPRSALGFDCDTPYGHQDGMTLRDWFAGQALVMAKEGNPTCPQFEAEFAYKIADAMLAARTKGGDA
jgi:hypothetical protein